MPDKFCLFTENIQGSWTEEEVKEILITAMVKSHQFKDDRWWCYTIEGSLGRVRINFNYDEIKSPPTAMEE